MKKIIRTIIELHGGGDTSEFLAPLGAVVVSLAWFSIAGVVTLAVELISGNIDLGSLVGISVGFGGIFTSLILAAILTA